MRTYSKTVPIMASAVAAALALAGCGSAGGSPSPADGPQTEPPGSPATVPTVQARNIAFEPDALTVAHGTAVTWNNADSVDHTVTHGTGGTVHGSALFDMPLPPGQSVTYTFEAAGSFAVTCTIHPQMQMDVTVTP